MKIKTSKGAAFTEYALLAGLVGSVSLFVLLDFGNTATSTYTAQASVIETQLASAGLDFGGVLGDGGGGIYINTNEPPPVEPPPAPVEWPPELMADPVDVLFSWFNGTTTDIMPGSAGYLLQDFPTGLLATALVSENPWSSQGLTRAFAFNMNIAGGPYVESSVLGMSVGLESRTVDIVLPEPVENAQFRIGGFNSTLQGAVRIRETVTIHGLALDGETIYPTTSTAFVSNEGPGVFGGSIASGCTTLGCAADFVFAEPVEEISITFHPLPSTVSGGTTVWTWAQIWVSDIHGTIWE